MLEAWAVAPAPAGVSPEQAATLPLNGTTADQALDLLDLSVGQWLLVTGAAGGVGALAIELAVIRGLRVVAQAGPGTRRSSTGSARSCSSPGTRRSAPRSVSGGT